MHSPCPCHDLRGKTDGMGLNKLPIPNGPSILRKVSFLSFGQQA